MGIANFSCFGQQEYAIKSDIRNECSGKTVSFFNMKLKYPLNVKEATKEYGLSYISNGSYHKTISSLPIINQSVPYNFKLLYVTRSGDGWNDQVPDSFYQDRLVKGYSFLLKTTSYNFDSLRTSLEQQFGGKFIRRQQTIPKSFQQFKFKREEQFGYEMRISECLYLAMSDFKSQGTEGYEFLSFYFDMTTEERTLFLH
jgi:hypothetical protein